MAGVVVLTINGRQYQLGPVADWDSYLDRLGRAIASDAVMVHDGEHTVRVVSRRNGQLLYRAALVESEEKEPA